MFIRLYLSNVSCNPVTDRWNGEDQLPQRSHTSVHLTVLSNLQVYRIWCSKFSVLPCTVVCFLFYGQKGLDENVVMKAWHFQPCRWAFCGCRCHGWLMKKLVGGGRTECAMWWSSSISHTTLLLIQLTETAFIFLISNCKQMEATATWKSFSFVSTVDFSAHSYAVLAADCATWRQIVTQESKV